MILYIFILYAILLSVGLALRGFPKPSANKVSSPKKQVSKILIVGATGGTGRQLVTQALELNFEVTAFARNPSALRMEHTNLRVVQGDVLDYASVEAAMHNQDAVLCALGHKRFFYPTHILSAGTRNLIRAMEAQNVSRLVCETSLGFGSSVGRMGLYYTFFVIPIILPFYFWDKTRQERIIAESNREWVIVRPGMLTNGAKKGSFRHGQHVGNFLWTVRIPRANVAEFMLDQLADDTYVGTSVGVCG